MRFGIVILTGLLSLGFAQVSMGQEPPKQEPASDQAPMKEPSKEASSETTAQYVYDPTGKKDPFKPYRAPRARGENLQAAPIDPLTQLDVSQVQLVGILWNTAKPKAVIRDSQGRLYVLFKNTRIGRNEGVVVDIREGEVIIVEKFDDGLGNVIREARTLEMKVVPGNQNKTAGG